MFISQSGAFIHNSYYKIDIKRFTTDVGIEKSDEHLIIYNFALHFLYIKAFKRNNGQINTNRNLNLC